MLWTTTFFIWQYYLLCKLYFVEYFAAFEMEMKVMIFQYLHLNNLSNIWELQKKLGFDH